MKTRNRTILNFVVFLTIMALTGQAGAGIQPRLEGSLSQQNAMVVTTRTSTTVAIEGAVIHLETGALRLVRGGSEGGFLQIDAVGLTPESRYMILAGQTPIYAFSGDSNGLYSARITDRIQVEGSVMVRNSGRPFASGLSGLTVVNLATGLIGYSRPDHAKSEQTETTPLCADDQTAEGLATVTAYGDVQLFIAEGWGLPASVELMVIADGVPVGSAMVDPRGYFMFQAGNVPGTNAPIPPELIPVTDISEVLIIGPDQAPVLFGNFDDPCTDGGGGGGDPPTGSGSIFICGSDTNTMIGSMDWITWADGIQVAMVSAFELPPDILVDVAFDAILIGTAPTGPRGDFFVTFSTDPLGDELPFPPNAPPLDQVETVDLISGDVVLGSGVDGEECDWIDPPVPVDESYTALCPVDPGTFAFGESGWVIWDDGTEDFYVSAMGLEPFETLTLIVDSHDLGAFTASERGDLNLWFSSNHGGDILDLPSEIRPVSSIDQVSLVSPDGAPIVAGSFIDGCDDLPDPPVPLDEDFTNLCPVDPGSFAAGETGWVVWDDGTEDFFVGVYELQPLSTWNLIVDGHDLGAFTASDRGEINLWFSSNPNGGHGGNPGMDVLPLPDEIRPVSSIDQVSLVSPDGAPIVAGSFIDGCDDIPDPPVPVDEDYTQLCPVDPGSFASGMTGWTVWDDGTENFFVDVFGLDPNSALNLIVDGHDLGAFTASDRGDIFLQFSSDPSGGGGPGQGGDFLPLPDEIQPVSSIDQVSLVSPDGAPIVAGSFIDGCGDIPDPPVPVDEGYTQLCPATANMAAGEVGWITWDDGTEQLMVAAFPLEPDASYQIIIDGFDLGLFDVDRDGSLWVDFSSDPIFAGQVPLPEDVQPVSNIDVVEIRDAQGTVIVAGSFSEPCSMEWDYEADATGLCNDADGHGGDSWWWMNTINGHAVEEGLFVFFWEAEDATTYSVVIDGIDIGEMAPIYGRDSLVLVLNLGNPGDEPIPDELSPISGIDIVQIFDGAGQLVVSGSYSESCSGDDPWDPGDGPRSSGSHHSVD